MGKLRNENESSGFEKDIDSREVKRHKQLNYGQGQLDARKADHLQAEEVSNSGILMPNSELELQKVPEPIGIQAPKSSDDLFVNQSVCAFCHSSKISQVRIFSVTLILISNSSNPLFSKNKIS